MFYEKPITDKIVLGSSPARAEVIWKYKAFLHSVLYVTLVLLFVGKTSNDACLGQGDRAEDINNL